MIAILLAAALVPPGVDGALAIEDASGLRAFFTAAGRYAASVSPESIGRSLRNRVGVDLLADRPGWGLGRGTRIIAVLRGGTGLSAPVADVKAAHTALDAWRRAGPPDRVGRISGKRLLTASGRGSVELLKALAHPQPLPPPLATAAGGKAWVYVRMTEPLRVSVLQIDASAQGLGARGIVTASAPILAGRAPAGCDGGPPACVRAGLAPAGRGAMEVALQRLRMPPQPDLRTASRVEERLDEIDARRLDALAPRVVIDGRESADGPALAGHLDLAQVAAALARLTPLDALSGPWPAGAYAAHLVYGPLLRNAGPLTLTGDPLPSSKDAAQVELRLPLR